MNESNNLYIKESKWTLAIIIVMFLIPILVIAMFKSSEINQVGYFSFFFPIVLALSFLFFWFIKEFKNFRIIDDILIVEYAYMGALCKPRSYNLQDISFFRVIKYSHQTNGSPVFKVYFKDNKMKKFFFQFRGKSAYRFQLLIDALRERGKDVVIEGDYWH